MSWKMSAALALAMAAGPAAGLAAEPMERHVVVRGDTLYDLAQRYFLRIGDYRVVQRLNKVSNPRKLPVGKELKIPERLLRTSQIEAYVASYRGAVSVSMAGVQIPMASGLALREGAIITTGANAFVRLDLPDGTHLSIPSQSKVRLGHLRAVDMTGVVTRELEVQSGRLESDVTPMRNPRDSYKVKTPMSVSAVRGTEFRVAYDAVLGQANTEVIEGVVSVSGEQAATMIAASYGAIATADGVVGPLNLFPAPALANPGKVQDEKEVRFQVSGPAAPKGYQLRLASDAGFVDVLNETEAPGGDFGLPDLADGVYFLRLAAIDERGLVGMPATYAFERRLNTLSVLAPTISKEGRVRRYKFRWQAAGAGERTYRLQLSREGSAAPVIDEAGLTAQELTVTDLAPGVYDWRVMSRTFARGGYVEKWSPAERFEIGR